MALSVPMAQWAQQVLRVLSERLAQLARLVRTAQWAQ
jgi:hypothetical protein